MDTKTYKVIPFEDVKIGQEFENADLDEYFSPKPWVKIGKRRKSANGDPNGFPVNSPAGCLVRIADCEPVLDFDTWWEEEGCEKVMLALHGGSATPSSFKESHRTSWENGAYKAREGAS